MLLSTRLRLSSLIDSSSLCLHVTTSLLWSRADVPSWNAALRTIVPCRYVQTRTQPRSSAITTRARHHRNLVNLTDSRRTMLKRGFSHIHTSTSHKVDSTRVNCPLLRGHSHCRRQTRLALVTPTLRSITHNRSFRTSVTGRIVIKCLARHQNC